jgi:hypothetical protein
LSANRKVDERPPAPWGSFPLAELTVLAGIVLLVIGVAGGNRTALVLGLALGALGGLEVAVREHIAGYRSHTTLLAGTVFVAVVGGLQVLAGLAVGVSVGLGALASAIAFVGLRRVFQRASGGLSFRVGRLRG